MTAKPSANKLWGGRFQQVTDRRVELFTASIPYDWRLYRHDIAGSIAHCRMLGQCGIISPEETETIVAGLEAIRDEMEREIQEGRFVPDPSLEDIHTTIEQRLLEKIGPASGKLHTARSRNDQIALDLRLYLRDEIDQVASLLRGFQKALVARARETSDVIMPGYTHLQRAQPVVVAHHFLAYYDMAERDRNRLRDCRTRVNILPLGAGALAGSSFPLDRGMVARSLGFDAVSTNSLDSVSDRDFVVEFLSAAALIMVHLSRLGEELVLWSSSEFGFVELPESFCTGSSIMPQKRNPDVPELVRGKAGRVFGALMALLTILKGLPLSYNRDLQEDKEPLFEAIDTVKGCLEIMAPAVEGMRIDSARLLQAARQGFLTATEVADYLVRKGLPFREAHRIVGKAVVEAARRNAELGDLSLKELRSLSPAFEEDVRAVLDVQNSVASKNLPGGTAPAKVRERIVQIEEEWRREAK
ncbi:MAG TPA: argininosuccinate lyase [bacterium]|nr:argininosuccinate lyase [bacterium]